MSTDQIYFFNKTKIYDFLMIRCKSIDNHYSSSKLYDMSDTSLPILLMTNVELFCWLCLNFLVLLLGEKAVVGDKLLAVVIPKFVALVLLSCYWPSYSLSMLLTSNTILLFGDYFGSFSLIDSSVWLLFSKFQKWPYETTFCYSSNNWICLA